MISQKLDNIDVMEQLPYTNFDYSTVSNSFSTKFSDWKQKNILTLNFIIFNAVFFFTLPSFYCFFPSTLNLIPLMKTFIIFFIYYTCFFWQMLII